MIPRKQKIVLIIVLTYKFYLTICNVEFMINAPRYVRDACAYLINDNLQLHDNNCVMFDMQEISTASVQFSYWKKGKLQFCKTIKKVQTLFFSLFCWNR